MGAVQKQLGVTLKEIEKVLEILQKLEPTGLFARDLSECLKLQARERDELTTTMSVVLNNLELLAKGEFKELCMLAKCNVDDIKNTAIQLRQYNPKPGSQFEYDPIENQREPDLIVKRTGEEIEITLNRASLPSVKVNLEYAAELKNRLKQKMTLLNLSKIPWQQVIGLLVRLHKGTRPFNRLRP